MGRAAPAAARTAAGVRVAWRRLNLEQRLAAIGAVLLIVSTFGPFSFVELALILVAGGVLWLLKSRADGKRFHLPFGDGSVILAAGVWSALLIVVRLFDRPLGQNLLALACAGILAVAGLLERAKRPPDDLPEEPEEPEEPWPARHGEAEAARAPSPRPPADPQAPLPGLPDRPADVPEPDTPPEFEPPTRRLPEDSG